MAGVRHLALDRATQCCRSASTREDRYLSEVSYITIANYPSAFPFQPAVHTLASACKWTRKTTFSKWESVNLTSSSVTSAIASSLFF